MSIPFFQVPIHKQPGHVIKSVLYGIDCRAGDDDANISYLVYPGTVLFVYL